MFNKLKLWTLTLCLAGIISACKKESVEQEIVLELKELQVSNTTQNSFSLSYQLNNLMFSETGIAYGTDSVAIANESTGSMRLKGVEKDGHYVVIARKLSPFTTYWYRVYAVDHKGILRFFKMEKVLTNDFNIRWPGGFKKILLQSTDLGLPLQLLADQPDLDLKNYKVTFGNYEYPVVSMSPLAGTEHTYTLQLRLWESQSLATGPFRLYYKGALIFESELSYDDSNQVNVTQLTVHPSGYGGNAFFKFKDKIYSTVLDVSAWNPQSNTWSVTGHKLNDAYGTPSAGDEGLELDGKVWFRPFSAWDGAFIRSYDPDKDIWRSHKLMDYIPLDVGQEIIDNSTSFVYQGKIYAFFLHSIISAYPEHHSSKSVLYEFDPVTSAWTKLMDLDTKIANYKAVVFKDKIYVTATTRRTQFTGTATDFRSLWYELDLKAKKLIEKAPLVIDGFECGALKPAMFNYLGHLMLYGGLGYDNAETRNLYEYLPEEDKWKRYFVRNPGSVPGRWSFCYVIADRIYVGMGTKNGVYELSFAKPLPAK